MDWTQYPTPKDRDKRENGIPVKGRVWSAASAPGDKWVLPEGCDNKTANLVVVNTRMGNNTSVGELPPTATAAQMICSICGHYGPDMKHREHLGPICKDRNACQKRAADRLAGSQ